MKFQKRITLTNKLQEQLRAGKATFQRGQHMVTECGSVCRFISASAAMIWVTYDHERFSRSVKAVKRVIAMKSLNEGERFVFNFLRDSEKKRKELGLGAGSYFVHNSQEQRDIAESLEKKGLVKIYNRAVKNWQLYFIES